MAPEVGLEPTTDRLTADCSTTELLSHNIYINSSVYPTGIKMAVRTGLEPATSCVTGRHSNQLNYRTICAIAGTGFEPVTFGL